MDSDYRRDMASGGGGGGIHHEARGRDSGIGVGAATLQRRNRVRGVRPAGGDSSADASPVGARSSSSAREEERRKVVEIEMKRRSAAAAAGGAAPVSRSSSRVSRAAQSAPPPGTRIVKSSRNNLLAAAVEHDSSPYSAGSSSLAVGTGTGLRKEPSTKRFDRVIRVKRSTSNAANNGVKMVNGRKKIPASVTSSLNSSESEPGMAAAAAQQRSVFLHSAIVVDIPPQADKRVPRAVSADASLLGGRDPGQQPTHPPPPPSQSNLKNSKKISRSISLLAPWKPRPVARQFQEIHYDNNTAVYNKPPRPPVPPVTTKGRILRGDKKSASSSDLLHVSAAEEQQQPPQTEIGMIGEQRVTRTLHRRPANSTPPAASNNVSRSVSMPKDTRLAGWFRKKKKT